MSGGERRREPLVESREYVFLQDEGGGGAERSPELRLRIPEVLDSEYGMYVWPCAPVLAQYIWFHRASMTGKRVLEVGAGVSLPGIVAAKCGANVILSDSAVLPQCLENCFRSCAQNNLTEVPVIGLTWGEISPDLLALPPINIILGSDVFYEPKDFEDVLVTVRFIMERNPSAEFWTTYQVRRTFTVVKGGEMPPLTGPWMKNIGLISSGGEDMESLQADGGCLFYVGGSVLRLFGIVSGSDTSLKCIK